MYLGSILSSFKKNMMVVLVAEYRL